jgi:hypothetical protein
VVVFSTKAATTDGLVATTSAPGATAAAYKLILQRRQEPTPEAIAEFFKGIPFHEGPLDVSVPLMLANLHSHGDLDRIRAEVKGI